MHPEPRAHADAGHIAGSSPVRQHVARHQSHVDSGNDRDDTGDNGEGEKIPVEHPCHDSRPTTSFLDGWWSMLDSNQRPPACEAGALPTELIDRDEKLTPQPTAVNRDHPRPAGNMPANGAPMRGSLARRYPWVPR